MKDDAATHAFQVTVPLPPNVPIDAFASAYERCLLSRVERYWLFRLGSSIPGRNAHTQPIPLPGLAANMRIGQPVGALSTVAAKDQATKELLLTWVHPPTRAMGVNWLKITPAPAASSSTSVSSSASASVSAGKDFARQVIAHDKVHLQLGSSLDTSACTTTTTTNSLFASLPAPAVNTAHALYLRMMLLNAAVQLWWDLRHVIRPDPVQAAKVVAERVGVHVPNLPGTAPAGGGRPMVEDRTSAGNK
ncbi:hypothetical protein BCR44DRAFT_1430977 [Catenaria anguillulae PL171]|uniref:Uncharacterized protein n=1 Tax=Catenaria anguillulae PL171 TaxID=765915 RepID=A0A1Y2HS35_9FUNG|nr:hypothetical protein BCR44DRAFT_1430977 [Catenaria anguillulae PL171]